MTDLIISTIILALYTIGCFAVWLRLRHLDRRRAHRALRRRILVYRITREHPAKLPTLERPSNVYELDPYSRKVS